MPSDNKKTTRLLATIPPYKPQAEPSVQNFNPFMPKVPQVQGLDLSALGGSNLQIGLPSYLPAQVGVQGMGGSDAPPDPYDLTAENSPTLPSPHMYTSRSGSPDAVVGGSIQNSNQPTNQPMSPSNSRAIAPGSMFGSSQAIEDALTYAPQTQGTVPDFTGAGMRSFYQPPAETMIAPPMQQYDPARAAEISRALSFMPLISMLGGGDAGYASRALPGMIAQGVGGDMGRWNEGQSINQRFMQSIANARNADTANSFKAQELAQKGSEDFTKRAVATASAKMAQSELDQKVAEWKAKTSQGLVDSEMKRASTANEIQSWLSMLSPEAQVAWDRNTNPAYKQYYGVGLPKDEQGNPVPLTRANPNEPSERMMKQKLMDNLIEMSQKNPEYQTPEGQLQVFSMINSLMEELGITPDMMFTRPVTTNISPKDKAGIATDKAKLKIAGYNAETDRMRAGTYSRAVGTQGTIGLMNANTNRMRADMQKAAAGAFGSQAKALSTGISVYDRMIVSTEEKLQALKKGGKDPITGKYIPISAKQLADNGPAIKALEDELKVQKERRGRLEGMFSTVITAGGGAAGAAEGGFQIPGLNIPGMAPPTQQAPPDGSGDDEFEKLFKMVNPGG